MLQPFHLSSITLSIRLDPSYSLQNATTNVHHFLSRIYLHMLSFHQLSALNAMNYHMENIDRSWFIIKTLFFVDPSFRMGGAWRVWPRPLLPAAEVDVCVYSVLLFFKIFLFPHHPAPWKPGWTTEQGTSPRFTPSSEFPWTGWTPAVVFSASQGR